MTAQYMSMRSTVHVVALFGCKQMFHLHLGKEWERVTNMFTLNTLLSNKYSKKSYEK